MIHGRRHGETPPRRGDARRGLSFACPVSPGPHLDEAVHFLPHLDPRPPGPGAVADLGFLCLDDDGDDPVVVTGFEAASARGLASAEKEANRVLAAGRVPVERGRAHLKNRRILTRLRTDPGRATHLFRALLVLTDVEVTTDD
ncbi:hypothetical protein ACF05T_27925 [Streptomyces lateritius]|uniref:Uncharacterized protein n=1 Tax=Streptomyces lateritius TaxID=67313 RepID=A0ABW6YJ52_9ACTN